MTSPRRRITLTFALFLVLAIGAPSVLASTIVPNSGSTRPVASAVKHYANCAALNKAYPHGVGRKGAKDHVSGTTRRVTNFKVSTAIYNANKGRDRDKDGVACEKR